jgi:hypothetical protein
MLGDDETLAEVFGHDTAAADRERQLRRQRVLEMWLRRVSIGGIARALKISETTVRRDVDLIRARIACDRGLETGPLLDAAVARLSEVATSAWTGHLKAPPNSQAGPAYLKLAMDAELAIAKLQGVDAPGHVHARTVATILDTVVEHLREAGPEQTRLFMERLRSNGRDQASALLLLAGGGSGGTMPDAPACVVEAVPPDEDDAEGEEEVTS